MSKTISKREYVKRVQVIIKLMNLPRVNRTEIEQTYEYCEPEDWCTDLFSKNNITKIQQIQKLAYNQQIRDQLPLPWRFVIYKRNGMLSDVSDNLKLILLKYGLKERYMHKISAINNGRVALESIFDNKISEAQEALVRILEAVISTNYRKIVEACNNLPQEYMTKVTQVIEYLKDLAYTIEPTQLLLRYIQEGLSKNLEFVEWLQNSPMHSLIDDIVQYNINRKQYYVMNGKLKNFVPKAFVEDTKGLMTNWDMIDNTNLPETIYDAFITEFAPLYNVDEGRATVSMYTGIYKMREVRDFLDQQQQLLEWKYIKYVINCGSFFPGIVYAMMNNVPTNEIGYKAYAQLKIPMALRQISPEAHWLWRLFLIDIYDPTQLYLNADQLKLTWYLSAMSIRPTMFNQIRIQTEIHKATCLEELLNTLEASYYDVFPKESLV